MNFLEHLDWIDTSEFKLNLMSNQTRRLTSDFVWPHALHIFNTFVRLSSACSTRLHLSVITYWFSAFGAAATEAGSPFNPSFRSNASTNCAHVVSFVMPDIQRCSPCTQIGISSSSLSFDSESSLISSVDCDDTEIDAIDPNDELDDDVDKVHLIPLSTLWLRYVGRLAVRSSLKK